MVKFDIKSVLLNHPSPEGMHPSWCKRSRSAKTGKCKSWQNC